MMKPAMTSPIRVAVRTALDWLRSTDLVVLVAILAAVVALWTFAKIADEVSEGETQKIDERILLALRDPANPADPIGPHWVEEALRDLTALGGYTVLGLVTATVVGYLLLVRKFHAVGLVLVASVGGLVLSNLLKGIFARPRPELVPHLSYVHSTSFPSGHSMLSAVIYLTLGSLLDRLVQRPALRLYFLAMALLLSFLVGVSRVYLGVHYPTDVLAGWAVGLAWAVLCWLVARWLQGLGMVEEPSD